MTLPIVQKLSSAGALASAAVTERRSDRSMTTSPPRVAYFPDSFHEVNGVAHTSRHFEAFARRRNLPFLCVRAGDRAPGVHRRGQRGDARAAARLSLLCTRKRSTLRSSVSASCSADEGVLERFKPDLIHITGPSELGMLGAGLAHHLGLPLAASWHTNVHEYLARRSNWFLRMLPRRHSAASRTKDRRHDDGRSGALLPVCAGAVRAQPATLRAAGAEDRPALPPDAARRGCGAFQPGETATRRSGQTQTVLGFVGRLSIEKNVGLLVTGAEGTREDGAREFPLQDRGPRRR